MRRLSFGLALMVLAAACGPREGDDPGECVDGADNDRDGFFDCDDQDCVFAPDCQDGRDTNDTDTGTDTGDGTPDPRLLELNGADVDYTLAIVPDLPIFGFDECTMTYVGKGNDRHSAGGTRVTFSGTWERTTSDCPDTFVQLVWAPGGAAFHSFHFTADLAELDEWHAHEREDAWTTDEGDKPHWFITAMKSSYDHGSPTVTYGLEEPVPEAQVTLKHQVSFSFTK